MSVLYGTARLSTHGRKSEAMTFASIKLTMPQTPKEANVMAVDPSADLRPASAIAGDSLELIV